MSTRFTDARGRVWDLRISIADRKRILECGFDLAKPGECCDRITGDLLVTEPEKVAGLAYLIAHGQHGDVSREEFERSIVDGEAQWALAGAICAGVCSFFPIPSVRSILMSGLTELLKLSTSTASSGRRPEQQELPTPAPVPSAS